MKKHAQIYTLFLMFVFCTSSKGQNKTDLPKDTISSETTDAITPHGPSSIVRTIKQDRNGNIWIASWEGIFRYDGKSFTNITSKVSSARFFSVLEDRKGNFWFASIGSGVYYYDGKSFQNYTTKDGLANNAVTCIYEDKTGNIWFGTAGGASCYDGKSFRNYTTNEGLPNNNINSIIEAKSGKFWFGTRGDVCVYDGKTFTTFTNSGKPFKNVRTIIEDKKGNIWLGGDGLWRYNGSTFANFIWEFVGYLYEDKNGNIWTGSGTVLSRYEEKSLSDTKPTVSEITIGGESKLAILEANDGSIWFGSGDGVYRYDGSTIQHFKDKKDQESTIGSGLTKLKRTYYFPYKATQ